MTFIDLLIVAVLAISVISAFIKGFLVEIFSLAGIFVGLLVAAANYTEFASRLMSWVSNREVAGLVSFLLIALGVMLLAGLIGRLLRSTVRQVGLGFLDRLLGALFGFLKGCAVVTLIVMAMAAFLPNAQWMKNSRLMPIFLTAAHEGSHITPFEFGQKIRRGVEVLRLAPPWWKQAGN
jgi:membrane protein required for colicin V production